MSKSRKIQDYLKAKSYDSSLLDKGSSPIYVNQEELGHTYGENTDAFPTDLKSLLTLLAEDDDCTDVQIVLKSSCPDYCFINKACVVAVMDKTVVLRGCDDFIYISIDCICEIIVECEDILNEIFESHNLSGE